jgi:hypothetical protein
MRSNHWLAAGSLCAVAVVTSTALAANVPFGARAATLTKAGDTTWKGTAVSKQLGRGSETLTGKVTFRPDTKPSTSTMHFRITFKSGWIRGCFHNTVMLRPGNRYVWDGPGQITGTSKALRRYRGLLVHDGGLTRADDLDHVSPFEFDTGAPGKKC